MIAYGRRMTDIKRARQIIFILGCDLSGSLRFLHLSCHQKHTSSLILLCFTKHLINIYFYCICIRHSNKSCPIFVGSIFHFLLTHDLDDCIDHLFRPYLDSGIIISPHFQRFVGLEADSAARNIRNYNLRVIICRRSIFCQTF